MAEESSVEREIRRKLEMFRRFTTVCSSCQSEVPSGWRFCADCGTRLETACPSCGEPLPPLGARYCPHCGLAIPRTG
ncbi:MAG: zinc-ribbon domain-containing protein [Chloroflexi bacterium]|nr:zinc-ribbon domain-containing protein [Chloroflexota bacterium]